MNNKRFLLLSIIPLLSFSSCSPARSEYVHPSINFYKQYEISIDGTQEGNSDFDRLFTYMSNPNKSVEDMTEWGDKFFILFVQNDCRGCEVDYCGFKYLVDHWNQGEFIGSHSRLKLYTVYVDITDEHEVNNLFKDYFFPRYDSLFGNLSTVMKESDYAHYCGKDSWYTYCLEGLSDADRFATPTTFLYDPNGKNKTTLGVSEIIFNIPVEDYQTSTAYERAKYVYDCWCHQGVFGADN